MRGFMVKRRRCVNAVELPAEIDVVRRAFLCGSPSVASIFRLCNNSATPRAIACGICDARPPSDAYYYSYRDNAAAATAVGVISQCFAERCVWHPRNRRSAQIDLPVPRRSSSCKFCFYRPLSASGSMFMVRNAPPMMAQRTGASSIW